MTVSRRLGSAFGAVILVFLLVGAVVLYSVAQLAEANRWNNHTFKVLDAADGMLGSMVNMETGARGFLMAGEDRFLEPWNQGMSAFEKDWSEAKKLTADNPAQQKRLDEIKNRNAEFVQIGLAMIQLRRDVNGGKITANDLTAEFVKGKDKAAMDGFRGLQADFAKAESDLLVVRSAAVERYEALSRNAVTFGSLFAILIALGLGIWVIRSITRQLGGEPDYAANVAQQIAQGNLMVEVQIKDGDTHSLLAAMKYMRDSLMQVVSQVRTGAESVSSSSAEIASGNNDLSARTEQQASALEETAASM
ncbi:MAG TPA: chemotaxis protein, partial [Acidovorax sp.]|nr:chemotaxis protein [Acidovorax sp.]